MSYPGALGKNVLGFNSPSTDGKTPAASQELSAVEQQDLLGFGLIPEFIGRLPVIATLESLTEAQLIQILTEPKNALVKQYAKLVAMEGAKLSLTRDGLGGACGRSRSGVARERVPCAPFSSA